MTAATIYAVLDPDLTFTGVTDEYLAATNTDRSIVGRKLFDVFPVNEATEPGAETLLQTVESVLRHGRVEVMQPVRYDLPDSRGGFEERWWRTTVLPVLDGGEVVSITLYVEDLTGQNKRGGEWKANLLRAAQTRPGVLATALALAIVGSLFTAIPDLLDHSAIGFESRGPLHHVWHYAVLLGGVTLLAGLAWANERVEAVGAIIALGTITMNTTAAFQAGDSGGFEGALRLAVMGAVALRIYEIYRRPKT